MSRNNEFEECYQQFLKSLRDPEKLDSAYESLLSTYSDKYSVSQDDNTKKKLEYATQAFFLIKSGVASELITQENESQNQKKMLSQVIKEEASYLQNAVDYNMAILSLQNPNATNEIYNKALENVQIIGIKKDIIRTQLLLKNVAWDKLVPCLGNRDKLIDLAKNNAMSVSQFEQDVKDINRFGFKIDAETLTQKIKICKYQLSQGNSKSLDTHIAELYAIQAFATTHVPDNKLTCKLQILMMAYLLLQNKSKCRESIIKDLDTAFDAIDSEKILRVDKDDKRINPQNNPAQYIAVFRNMMLKTTDIKAKELKNMLTAYRGHNMYTQLIQLNNSSMYTTSLDHSLGSNGQSGCDSKPTPNAYKVNLGKNYSDTYRLANAVRNDTPYNERQKIFRGNIEKISDKCAVYQTLVDPDVSFPKDNEASLVRQKSAFANDNIICTNYSINGNGEPHDFQNWLKAFAIDITTTIPIQQTADLIESFNRDGFFAGLRDMVNPRLWFPTTSNNITNLISQGKIIRSANLHNPHLQEYKNEHYKMIGRTLIQAIPILSSLAKIGTHNLRTAALEALVVGNDTNKSFMSRCKSGKDREAILWCAAMALQNNSKLSGTKLLEATCRKYIESYDNMHVIANVSEGCYANKAVQEIFGDEMFTRIHKEIYGENTKLDMRVYKANAGVNKFAKVSNTENTCSDLESLTKLDVSTLITDVKTNLASNENFHIKIEPINPVVEMP